jgi:hypothetical protein
MGAEIEHKDVKGWVFVVKSQEYRRDKEYVMSGREK